MEALLILLLPHILLLARVTAFFAVLPVFGWAYAPNIVRVGMALVLTFFLAKQFPAMLPAMPAGLLAPALLLVWEVLCGLSLGLACRFVFQAVQQGGFIIAQQMGLTDAGVVDPVSGEDAVSVAMFFEISFTVMFLSAQGHHLLVGFIGNSFRKFPVGTYPSAGAMAGALVTAGSTMLLFALKLAAPALAAFLVLSFLLAILSRALPDLNILFDSFPMRVGLGLFLCAAMMPLLDTFTGDLADWMQRFFMG
jgi:flagellar biosynthesis protein FliR